jgi:hypothetical protein
LSRTTLVAAPDPGQAFGMTESRPTADLERRPGGLPVTVLLGLAGLAWGFGTPVLWYGAMIAGASFFGEPPSPAEQQASFRLLVWALACGFLLPSAGLVLALATRRRAAAGLMAVALALSVAGGVATGTLSRDAARELRDHLNPPETTADRWPRSCQEHSGPPNTCPGG